MAGTTTSIRLSPELRERLERAARQMHRGKSWVITHALEEFLSRAERLDLSEEAKRQSRRASEGGWEDEAAWDDDIDRRGWQP